MQEAKEIAKRKQVELDKIRATRPKEPELPPFIPEERPFSSVTLPDTSVNTTTYEPEPVVTIPKKAPSKGMVLTSRARRKLDDIQ